jgi:hypothetical protein
VDGGADARRLGDVARIVTAFTPRHSLTLSLAALGLAACPRGWWSRHRGLGGAGGGQQHPAVFGRDRWVVAFALGLLHGFGFSSVLADAGLPASMAVRALVGFNLGVELGQLRMVAAFVPLAFLSVAPPVTGGWLWWGLGCHRRALRWSGCSSARTNHAYSAEVRHAQHALASP